MLEIKFVDGTTIDSNGIMSLKQKAKMFDESFKLGSTICRQFDVEVDKNAISTIPDNTELEIVIDGTKYARLIIDDIDLSNTRYYKLSLVDKMVLLNANYDWSELEDKHITSILDDISTKYNIAYSTNATIPDMVVDWYEEMSARTFIGYVAELIGGYAYIDNTGILVLKAFERKPKDVIALDVCSSYQVSMVHKITRVVYDNGVATVIKGDESGETLYLNPDNILFADTETYTIDNLVEQIYNAIKDFVFYNIIVERCPIGNTIICGDVVYIGGLPTIVEIDWSYNLMWYGGYSLDLQNSKQEETQVVDSTSQKIKSLKILVDREANEIQQLIRDVEVLDEETKELQSSITQRANEIILQVQELENELETQQTTFVVKSDGAYIQQGKEENYAKFTDSGMQIYADNTKIAEATSDTFKAPSFTTDNWTIRESDGVLCFYKGEFE